ncbi:MAG: AAA-type ATPase lid domain-containing protein [Myxococcales bacterium]
MSHLLLSRDGVPLLRFPLDCDVTTIGCAGRVDLLIEHAALLPRQAELRERRSGGHRLVQLAGPEPAVGGELADGHALEMGPFRSVYRDGPRRDPDRQPELSPFATSARGRSCEYDGLVVAGEPLLGLVHRLEADRRHREPWVVVGEPGTGKRRLAQAFCHWLRCKGRLVPIDCTTAENAFVVLEAVASVEARQRLGLELFDEPLFIEPQHLLPDVQEALAAIEDRAPLFSLRRHPDALLAEGSLVPALHRRLRNVYELPTLRGQSERVPLLFERLLARFSPGEPPELTPSAADALRRHPWPGNVRELSHVAQRLLLGGVGPKVTYGDLRFGAA